MKLLIILLAMAGVGLGAFHSYQQRQLLIEAALLSEAYDLTGPVKLRLSDYYVQHGVMAADNAEAGLAAPRSIFGASVKRVTVNLGGVITVDFDDEAGKSSLTLTPSLSTVRGLLNWRCTSESVDPDVLEKIKPACHHLPATDQSELMHAIANRQLVSVEALLARGVKPSAIVNGNSPLMLAAKIGDVDIVNALLAAGAPVDHDALNTQRRTPLMVAIAANHAEVAATLLAHKASINVSDYQGNTALDHAKNTDARLGGERYVLMLSASLNPRFGVQDVENESSSVLQKQPDYLSLYKELSDAVQHCQPQTIRSVLRLHGEFGDQGIKDGMPISQHMKQPGCRVHLQQYLAGKSLYQFAVRASLLQVARSCNVKDAEKLFNRHSDAELVYKVDGVSLLEQAVHSGCTEIVSSLLRRRGEDIALPADLLISALENSPSDKLLRIVSILTAADIDVNAVDRKMRTPLGVAIAIEQPVVAKYLIDAGADVSKQTRSGSYPLIDASQKGYDHLVTQLIKSGAQINAQDRVGRSAILVAVAQEHRRLVDILLRSGANPRIKDKNGIDAVILAQSKDQRHLQRLLTASASSAIEQ